MGFQDRGYVRQRHDTFMADWTGVTLIIVLNVSLWLLNFLLSSDLLPFKRSLDDLFCLRVEGGWNPLQAWQLLTYGFLHDPDSPWHLLFNIPLLGNPSMYATWEDASLTLCLVLGRL